MGPMALFIMDIVSPQFPPRCLQNLNDKIAYICHVQYMTLKQLSMNLYVHCTSVLIIILPWINVYSLSYHYLFMNTVRGCLDNYTRCMYITGTHIFQENPLGVIAHNLHLKVTIHYMILYTYKDANNCAYMCTCTCT